MYIVCTIIVLLVSFVYSKTMNQTSVPAGGLEGNVDLGAKCKKHQAIVKKNEGHIIEVHNYAEFLKAVNGMLGMDGPAIFKFEIRKDVVSSKPKNKPDMMIVSNIDERILDVPIGKEGKPVTFDDIISMLEGIGKPRVERRGSKIVYVPDSSGRAEMSIDMLNILKDMVGKDGPYYFQHDIVHSSNLDLELDAVRAAQGVAAVVETGIGSEFVEPTGELSKVPIGEEGKEIDMESIINAFKYVSTHKELEEWRKSGRSFFHEGFKLEGKILVMIWGS